LDKFQNPPANEKSQRDFIIQPGVDAMPSWLRWVLNQKMESTLKDLNRCARNGDAILLGLENILGTVDPGQRVPRNPGLTDGIPLGFGEAAPQPRRASRKARRI